jgi:hypothetical protein
VIPSKGVVPIGSNVVELMDHEHKVAMNRVSGKAAKVEGFDEYVPLTIASKLSMTAGYLEHARNEELLLQFQPKEMDEFER